MTRRRLARLAVLGALAALAAACVPVTPPPPSTPPPTGGTPTTKPPVPGAPKLTRTTLTTVSGSPIWDIAFTPDGMFFDQRNGQIWVRPTGSTEDRPLGPVPNVSPGGEGGLLGMTVDPDWSASANRFLYLCYSYDPGDGGATENRVAKWEVNAELTDFVTDEPEVIINGLPHNKSALGRHSGCRPRFKPGTTELWIGTGDAAMNGNPQSPTSLGGKVLRVDRNGAGLPGNMGAPYDPRIFSYGHRNVQGIAFSPSNVTYSAEHGPGTDDEVNRLDAPGDRGWHPDGAGSYNEGVPMTAVGAIPAAWSSGSPTLAPSGAVFLIGPRWKAYNGMLAVGMLKTQKLTLMKLGASGNVTSTTDVLDGLGHRLRSPVLGPDNNLYLATDSGQIWKVVPS